MTGSRLQSWLVAVLLAIPLVVVAVWLAAGGMHRAFGPRAGTASPPSRQDAAAAVHPLPGFPTPAADLGPDRFEQQVDGAAEALKRAGCVRLLVWRLDDPPSELDLLVFRDADGAAAALERDAGPDRTPGPGDEAWAGASAVFFRRGNRYARILPDPSATSAGAAILDLARKVDEVLTAPGGANR